MGSGSGFRYSIKIETILPCYTPNMSTKFHLNPSTTFWDIVLSIIFGPISQWWSIIRKILVVGSGSTPKSNLFVLVSHPTCPQSFIRIRPQLFEISCTQTRKRCLADHDTCKIHYSPMDTKRLPWIQKIVHFIKIKIDNLNQSSPHILSLWHHWNVQ